MKAIVRKGLVDVGSEKSKPEITLCLARETRERESPVRYPGGDPGAGLREEVEEERREEERREEERREEKKRGEKKRGEKKRGEKRRRKERRRVSPVFIVSLSLFRHQCQLFSNEFGGIAVSRRKPRAVWV